MSRSSSHLLACFVVWMLFGVSCRTSDGSILNSLHEPNGKQVSIEVATLDSASSETGFTFVSHRQVVSRPRIGLLGRRCQRNTPALGLVRFRVMGTWLCPRTCEPMTLSCPPNPCDIPICECEACCQCDCGCEVVDEEIEAAPAAGGGGGGGGGGGFGGSPFALPALIPATSAAFTTPASSFIPPTISLPPTTTPFGSEIPPVQNPTHAPEPASFVIMLTVLAGGTLLGLYRQRYLRQRSTSKPTIQSGD